MNTLELLVALLPALYVAARYWSGVYVAAVSRKHQAGWLASYWRAACSRSSA